jgi:hypothetical protein
VNETDNIAFLVNYNKASAHGNDVFDIRDIVLIQFLVTWLHGQSVA